MLGSVGPEERRVSLRSFYAFDELRRHHGPSRAAHLVFGPDVAPSVLDAADDRGGVVTAAVIFPELLSGREDDGASGPWTVPSEFLHEGCRELQSL